MPKRKSFPKIPDYVGLPKNVDKMLVQKSTPLQSLTDTGMRLTELKILDAYLARIDSHDIEKRTVRFSKGEIEKLLDVTKISLNDLDKRLDGLFTTVTVRDKNARRGFLKLSLFEKAQCEQNEEGIWQVDLTCTITARQYIFNIEAIGYLRYRLKNIIHLTSRYSYILYLYLENFRQFGQKQCGISVEDLKEMLQCIAESFENFKVFNARIIKKCQQEINKKTDLHFEYECKRTGRRITDIIFTISDKPKTMSEKIQEMRQDTETKQKRKEREEKEKKAQECHEFDAFLSVFGFETSDAKNRELKRILEKINPPDKDEYMQSAYNQLISTSVRKVQRGEKPINDRFAYFCKILESGVKQPRQENVVEEGRLDPCMYQYLPTEEEVREAKEALKSWEEGKPSKK